jgi:serine/threonine protein kinase
VIKPHIIKEKYSVGELITEDLVSYLYHGQKISSGSPIFIWQYKEDLLDASLVSTLIERAEKMMVFQDSVALSLLDYEYDGKSFVTIYEYCQGMETLESYLTNKKPKNLKTLWRFSNQLLSFLTKIESKQYLCGAINLSTIYVLPNGRIKVARSGILIEVMRRHWGSFSVVEDIMFYSPEMIQFSNFSIQSDIYSFGVLLYVFFSGQWPYKMTMEISVLKLRLLEPHRPFEPSHPAMPDRLRDIIHICLNLDEGKRFSSFEELIKSYKGIVSLPSQPLPRKQSTFQSKLKSEIATHSRVRKRKKISWMIGLFSVVLCLLFIFLTYKNYMTSIPEKEVPNIIGLTFEEAEILLNRNDLKGEIVGSRVHPDYPKGTIVESKPAMGRRVKLNRTVRLFLSRGAGLVLVPDLVGFSQEKAIEKLHERDLSAEVIEDIFSLQYKEGIIISQTPIPNTYIEPSENVKLVLSKGMPIEVKIKRPRFSFFYDDERFRRAFITLFVLDEWDSQDISILFSFNGTTDTLYRDIHAPGESISLDYDLEIGGNIDVFFGQENVYSYTITADDMTIDTHDE